MTLILVTCGISACDLFQGVGPCIVHWEPIINLATVVNDETEENIETVTISNLYYNDILVVFDTDNMQYSQNVEINSDDNSFICTLPCAFFMENGNYTFTVSSAGYLDHFVEVDAVYDSTPMFCGGALTYGLQLELRLLSE